MNDGVIVITECPKCGTIRAARSKWAELPKDGAGVPIENGAWKFNVECAGCLTFEIKPIEFSGLGVNDFISHTQRNMCYALGIPPGLLTT